MPDLAEVLLEMHFFRAMVDHFASVYGATFLRLFKPCPQQEAWVGFDQGWIRTTLTTDQLFDELRKAIQRNESTLPKFYFGYFLQFKVVQKMKRRSRNAPQGYDTPYYRVRLSSDADRRSKLSQHETLLRLNAINQTKVCYACPMLFEEIEIYKEPNLDQLICVDIGTSPTGWATHQDHFIVFRTPTDSSPLWCSEPLEAKAYPFQEWASHSDSGPRKLSPKKLMDLIETAVMNASEEQNADFSKAHRFVHESFTLIEFEHSSSIKARIAPGRMPEPARKTI